MARPLNDEERWAIAGRLNTAHPKACWAQIASWAMNPADYGFDPDSADDRTYVLADALRCQEEGKTGACWCGKFMSDELRNAPPPKSLVEILSDPEYVAASEARAAEREARMVARYGENPTMPPYRPSNGTEGDYFQAKFCERCVHDAAWREFDELCYTNPAEAHYIEQAGKAPEPCEILSDALMFDVDDPGYPGETWVYFNGKPTCLKFRERGSDGDDSARPVEPDPSQLDMFIELPVLVPA